jgi:hypothetical protein
MYGNTNSTIMYGTNGVVRLHPLNKQMHRRIQYDVVHRFMMTAPL